MKEINLHIEQIRSLCDSNKVKALFAFGSVTTDKFNINSDIDLVVDIDETDPINYSDYYFSLKTQLENLFRRHIDLLEQKAIKNPYLKKEIDQTKVLIYVK